jgi:hypothetical protein
LNQDQHHRRRLLLRRLALAATCAVPLAGPFPAAAGSFQAQYDISLSGIPIGVADVGAQLEGERYRLDLRARLTGLVGVLTGGKGGATASGTLSGAHVYPSSFALTSATGEATRTLRMALDAGTVQQVEIAPPLPDWDKPDRVPVSEAHKRNIVDPLSAVLMPVTIKAEGTEAAACNRSIPVFDGAMRFNIVLAYAGSRSVDSDSYRGPVVVCSVRYVPIAGHRPNRRVTKFMEANREIETWLAPLPGEKLFVPYRISVKTLIGTTVIEASRFTGEGTATAAVPGKPKRAKN